MTLTMFRFLDFALRAPLEMTEEPFARNDKGTLRSKERRNKKALGVAKKTRMTFDNVFLAFDISACRSRVNGIKSS